jgi:L-cysteate sulfo-lyase
MTDFNLNSIPRISLCLLPTPIMPLKRLTEYLGGGSIFIKRDDLTGIAYGGNKNRKLEFLLADAREKRADVIVTEGALQSNHCVQTAACSAKLGLDCELVLSGEDSEVITGNLLLDQILDVKIHRVKDSSERKNLMEEVEEELRAKGKRPYIIPTGGSTKVGALGYLNSILEIAKQSKELGVNFDFFVHSTGSGGTQAGVLIGKEIYYPELEVLGINVGAPKERLQRKIKEIIKDFTEEWELDIRVKKDMIKILDDYYGEGYAIPNQDLIDTVKLIAKLEGIFLDPVYTGKAMVGLIDLIKTEVIPKEKTVLFLHSGGGPSLFNYNDAFKKGF